MPERLSLCKVVVLDNPLVEAVSTVLWRKRMRGLWKPIGHRAAGLCISGRFAKSEVRDVLRTEPKRCMFRNLRGDVRSMTQ